MKGNLYTRGSVNIILRLGTEAANKGHTCILYT